MAVPPIALGAFDVIEPIAAGGMGSVWRGLHRQQRVPVAIKVLSPQYSRLPGVRAAFHREARAVAGLNHPNVVLVFDMGQVGPQAAMLSDGRLDPHSPWLALELARTTLASSPPRTWAGALAVLEPLLQALAHAHARGLVHRDLKPQNILLAAPHPTLPDGPGPDRVVLSDFGLAWPHGDDSVEDGDSLAFGTPRYMAPEQFNGAWRDFGPWTDLYAVGCVAWTMIAGQPPFQSMDPQHLAHQHLFREPPVLRPCIPTPPGLEAWLRTLLRKNPADRYGRAADAARALGELGPATLPAVAPLQRFRPGTARQRASNETTLRTLDPFEPVARPSPLQLAGPDATVKSGTLAQVDWQHASAPHLQHRLLGTGLGLYGLRSVPFVGRVEERHQLWSCLQDVLASRRARAVVLSGPAGIGTTCLAQWLARRSHELGLSEVWSARFGTGPETGSPLRRMLCEHLRCGELPQAEVQQRLRQRLAEHTFGDFDTAALAELLAPPSPEAGRDENSPSRLSGPTERFALIQRLLAHEAGPRASVVLLDDAQWGPEGMALVEHVLDQASATPVLFLLTVREGVPLDRTLEAELLERLLASPHVRQLRLPPLSAPERAALVRQLLGLEGDLAAEVEERTAGNPFFAVELVGEWVAQGLLVVTDQGYRLSQGVKPQLPASLHEVWTTRVERFLSGRPPGDGRALELAAILGPVVDQREWLRSCALAGIEVDGAELVEGLASEKLALAATDEHPGRWFFTHELLRASLERRALEGRRLEGHHAACAGMLASSPAPRGEERLGRHLLASGDAAGALAPLLAGARHRTAQGDVAAVQSLLAMVEQAMTAVEAPAGDARWIEIWRLRAEAIKTRGDIKDALVVLERAERLARSQEQFEQLARLLVSKAEALVFVGRLGEALAQAREAERLAEEHGWTERSAAAVKWQGIACLEMGEHSRALELASRAEAGLRAAGDEAGRAGALYEMGVAAFKLGRLQEARRHQTAARSIHRRYGSRSGIASTENSLGEAARASGDYEAALAHYHQSLQTFEALGSRSASVTRLNIGLTYLLQKDYPRARVALEHALSELEASGHSALAGFAHAELLPCFAATGDWESWDHHLRCAADLLGPTSLCDGDTALAVVQGARLAREAAQSSRADAALRLAAEQLRRLGRDAEANAIKPPDQPA